MIYCIEDDDSIRDLVVYTLQATGFLAKGYADSKGMWLDLEIEKPSLILLDIMLPGENGIEVLKKIRAKSTTSEIPVIMATAKGTEFDKVIGLDTGADDYLVKPFGMMEMVSHIKAVLRRTEKHTKVTSIKIGDLVLNHAEHTVTVLNDRVTLTLKEYEMLLLFMKNPGRVYSREQLLEMIWESDYMGETRTIDVHIGTLRTKLGLCGDYIETVRGVGYRMGG